MTKDTQLDELAQRYLDLWQDQLAALASDQNGTEAMRQFVSLAAPAGTAAENQWLGLWATLVEIAGKDFDRYAQQGRSGERGEYRRNAGGSGPGSDATDTPTGPATAAATLDDSGPDLGELARRLARLEKRVASLEAKRKKPSRQNPKSNPCR